MNLKLLGRKVAVAISNAPLVAGAPPVTRVQPAQPAAAVPAQAASPQPTQAAPPSLPAPTQPVPGAGGSNIPKSNGVRDVLRAGQNKKPGAAPDAINNSEQVVAERLAKMATVYLGVMAKQLKSALT
jgi:hypothetical protein